MKLEDGTVALCHNGEQKNSQIMGTIIYICCIIIMIILHV